MKVVHLDYLGVKRAPPTHPSPHHKAELVNALIVKVPSINLIIKRDEHFLAGMNSKGQLYYMISSTEVFESSYEKSVYSSLLKSLPRNYKGAVT